MKLLSSLEAATPARLLPPSAESVLALAEKATHESRSALNTLLSRDPGLAAQSWHLVGLEPSLQVQEHELVTSLLDSLTAHPRMGFADWTKPQAQEAYGLATLASALGHLVAEDVDLAPHEVAAVAQLLLLGKLVQTQESDLGLLQVESFKLTRQLARRWSFPSWLGDSLRLCHAERLPPGNELAARLLRAAWVCLLAAAERFPDFPLEARFRLQDACSAAGISLAGRTDVQRLLHQIPSPPTCLNESAAELLTRALALTRPRRPHLAPPLIETLEEELEHAQGRVFELEAGQASALRTEKLQALAEFAAGAAHEINNPLAVISAQAQHLLRTEESLERAKALERIIAQGQRIHQLLRDLLLFARPPEPRRRLIRSEQIIQAAFAEVVDFAQTREVNLQRPKGRGRLRLKVDVELLTMALACLVKNAVAAAPAGGWVRIDLIEESDGGVTFLVEDNGAGIEAGAQAKLFDPFYSGRSAGRGVGLGLPKSWRIAQLHGGDLSFESEPGQPTRFRLRLGAEAVPSTAPQKTSRRPARAAAPRLRQRPAARRKRR